VEDLLSICVDHQIYFVLDRLYWRILFDSDSCPEPRVDALPHVEVWPTPASFYSLWDVRECFGMETPEARTLTCSNDVAEYLLMNAGVLTAAADALTALR